MIDLNSHAKMIKVSGFVLAGIHLLSVSSGIPCCVATEQDLEKPYPGQMIFLIPGKTRTGG